MVYPPIREHCGFRGIELPFTTIAAVKTCAFRAIDRIHPGAFPRIIVELYGIVHGLNHGYLFLGIMRCVNMCRLSF